MLETDEMSATSYRHKIDALLTAGAANLGCSKYSTALGHLGDNEPSLHGESRGLG